MQLFSLRITCSSGLLALRMLSSRRGGDEMITPLRNRIKRDDSLFFYSTDKLVEKKRERKWKENDEKIG